MLSLSKVKKIQNLLVFMAQNPLEGIKNYFVMYNFWKKKF